MKTISKRVLSLVMAMMLVFGLAAMAAADAEPTNVTIQIGPNPETLDPALNSAVDGGNMLLTLFENLLIVGEDGSIAPGQAESYTVSEDGLIWTFTMRDGLKWSDGTDLTAKDYEYSFKRVVDPEVAAPYGETVLGMVAGYNDVVETGDTDKLAV